MATIAALIVDVAARTASLEQSVERVHGSLNRIQQSASTAGIAIGAALGTVAAHAVERTSSALIGFGREALLTSARVETLGGVARFLGAQAGYSGAQIDALVAALRRQGITSQQANDTVIQMVRANLSLADATRLATVAQSLARATGENSSATLGKLIQGTQTLQVEVLRNAGVVIQLDQEYKKFAATNDRTVLSLSAQEKQQIALAAVLREGERVAGVYGVTNEFVGGKLQSMARHQEEAARSIGDVFKPALKVAVDALTVFLQLVQAAPVTFAFLGTAIIGTATAMVTLKAAAAMGAISVGALSTALAALWPIVAVGTTAFAAWQVGRWLGEVTGLTDAVERLAGRMMGLSSADIEASIAARHYRESSEGKAHAAASQAKALKDLEIQARAQAEADAARARAEIEAAEAMRFANEQATKWRQTLNWLGEEYMKADAAQMEFERSARQLYTTMLLLAPTITDNVASLHAYDLIAESNVHVVGEWARTHREANAELARSGMLMDFSAHTSNNASQAVIEQTNRWGELGGRIGDVATHMQTAINGSFAQMLLGAKGFKDGFLDIWQSLKAGVMNILNEILSAFINRFLTGIIGAMRGGSFSQAFAGMFGGLGGLFGGGGAGAASSVGTAGVGAAVGGKGILGAMGGFLTNPWTIGIGAAIGGFIGLKKLFGKSEHEKVNDMRDQFWAQVGGQGAFYERLIGSHGQEGRAAFDTIQRARTVRDYEAARASAESLLERGSESDGGGGDTYNFTIHALDGDSVEAVLPRIVEAIRRNRGGARSDLETMFGTAPA